MTKFDLVRIVRGYGLVIMTAVLAISMASSLKADQPSDTDLLDMDLEELLKQKVVTASRRAQSIQDTPMSLSSVKPDDFVSIGITTIGEMIDYVPGFSFVPLGQRGSGYLAARGVSQQGATPVIGVYVDDIPVTGNGPFSDGAIFFYDGLLGDYERIEFLKGPQGTLYGATSIGGAIKYISKKPELNQMRLKASTLQSSTRFGGNNHIYQGSISAPILEEKLGLTLSGFHESDSGYIDFVDEATRSIRSKDVNASKSKGFSGDLFLKMTSGSSLRLKSIHQQTSFDAYSRVKLDGSLSPQYENFQTDIPYGNIEQEHKIQSLTFEHEFDWAVFTLLNSQVEYKRPSNIKLVTLNDVVDSLEGNPKGTTTSIPIENKTGSKKFSQELRLVSKNNNILEWIAGIYYAKEKTENSQLAKSEPTGFHVLSISFPSEYTEKALFVDATYYFHKVFDVTLGLRMSEHETSIDFSQSGALAGEAFVPKDAKNNVTTYLLNFRFRPSDSFSLYSRVASGYRPASSNITAVNPDIKADEVWSYDFGAKGNIDASFLTYDLAIWYVDWNKFQTIAVIGNTTSVLANAAGGISAYGFEGEIKLKPTRNLTIDAGVSYSSSVLKKDEPSIYGTKGQAVPDIPHRTAMLRLKHDFTQEGNSKYFVGAGVRYREGSTSSFENGDPSNGVVNLHTNDLSLWEFNAGSVGKDFHAIFFVNNVFEKEGFFNPSSDESAVAVKPRVIGINLGYTY